MKGPFVWITQFKHKCNKLDVKCQADMIETGQISVIVLQMF